MGLSVRFGGRIPSQWKLSPIHIQRVILSATTNSSTRNRKLPKICELKWNLTDRMQRIIQEMGKKNVLAGVDSGWCRCSFTLLLYRQNVRLFLFYCLVWKKSEGGGLDCWQHLVFILPPFKSIKVLHSLKS